LELIDWIVALQARKKNNACPATGSWLRTNTSIALFWERYQLMVVDGDGGGRGRRRCTALPPRLDENLDGVLLFFAVLRTSTNVCRRGSIQVLIPPTGDDEV
jgi:hypothetical protein